MTEPTTDTLELDRADGGADLWAAVEAAQYARIVDHEPPQTDAEAACMADLVGLFTESSEDWERQSASDQKTVLEQIGHRLATLGEMGLFVYSGIIQARFGTTDGETVELPLAVLVIRREYHQTIAVSLPLSAEMG